MLEECHEVPCLDFEMIENFENEQKENVYWNWFHICWFFDKCMAGEKWKEKMIYWLYFGIKNAE